MCELDDSMIDKPKDKILFLQKFWLYEIFELTSFIWKGKNISLQSQNEPAGTIPETEMMNWVANNM